MTIDRKERLCIIGGGPAGLATAKALRQNGISFDIVEREDDFGGIWYFGRGSGKVYQSTHLISSKLNTQFSDFPMPAHYPDYPSHPLFLEYLRSLARHFRLYDHATFGAAVTKVAPEGPLWRVGLASGEERLYKAVMVASGRLSRPRTPRYPGQFDGLTLHAADYRGPDVFRGRRVLVIGGGNSGCDIAVDSAHVAARTIHSMRRGYHFMPKYIHGMPTQDWMMAEAAKFASTAEFWKHARATFKAAGFDGTDYGLPEPDHGIDEAHPIMNSLILYHVGHGDIAVKPDVARFDGSRVEFSDGSAEEIDVILYATGYDMALPFFDAETLGWKDGAPDLFMYTFHRRHHNLFFGGFFNAPSGFGNLANAAGQTLAAYLRAWSADTPAFRRFCELKNGPDPDLGQGRYYEAERHRYELDAWKLLKALNFLCARLESHDAEDMATMLAAPAAPRPSPLRRILEDVAAHRISEEAALRMLDALDAPAGPRLVRLEPEEVVPDDLVADDAAPDDGVPADDLAQRLLDDVVEHLVALLHVPREQLRLDIPLSDFGVDSILASEILGGVRKRYGITLPPTVLFEYRDIRSFVTHLAAAHAPVLARALAAREPAPAPIARPGIEVVPAAAAPDVFCDGSGAPVVFIGGLGTTWQVWREQITQLRDGHRLYVYHPPGHGRSRYEKRRFGLEQMTEEVAALLDEAGGGEPVPLVGWSLGGVIAASVAARYPGRVRALVLACTTACPRETLPAGRSILDELHAHPRGREWMDQAAGSLALDPAVLAHYKQLLAECDLRRELAAIQAPSLVIAGGRDAYMSPAVARDLQQRIAGARYCEMAQAGHFPMMTDKDEFTRIVARFLAEPDQPRTAQVIEWTHR